MEVVLHGALVDTEKMEKKNEKKTFCLVFGCSGRNSQWWWHPSPSRVLCGSSVWLGSVSVAIF
jgi:hypothetical protein